MLSKLNILLIKSIRQCTLLGGFLLLFNSKAQIVNYVNNGGFEQLFNCASNNVLKNCKYWNGIDSLSVGALQMSVCNGFVPLNGNTYQFPHGGNTYALTTFYFPKVYNPSRGYLKNRLKNNLLNGHTYCVKFYVNITNASNYGIDAFQAYFGDNSIDTITKGLIPITYLSPQVSNPTGNIIIDTLNWVPITGTFVATGNEKYIVLGNFKANGAVDSVLINSSSTYTNTFTDVCIDDVSVIDINLPAFAGRDTFFIPGDSIYLGRPSDVGIDEDCMWYKLPNTTTAIDTVAGLWVKPVTTTTYVVKQDICGVIKWDTVVLYQSAIGVHELDVIRNNLKIYPQPANNELTIQLNLQVDEPFNTYQIYNNLGQLIREEELSFKNYTARITIADFADGVYSLRLLNTKNESITKKLVIAK